MPGQIVAFRHFATEVHGATKPKPKSKNVARWERGFAALSKFRAREGHCRPSRHHVEGNFKLGDWVSTQRYRKDLLPAERKRRWTRLGLFGIGETISGNKVLRLF